MNIADWDCCGEAVGNTGLHLMGVEKGAGGFWALIVCDEIGL